MDRSDIDQHMSQLNTSWTILLEAHCGSDGEASGARARLLERYGRAAYRYLLAATRDGDRADELYQELALKLLRGDFRGADPDRGRFRDYLRTALSHLVSRERGRRIPLPLIADVPEPAVAPPVNPGDDEALLENWREELMNRTWAALRQAEGNERQPFHTVLRFRTDHTELNSQQTAQALGLRLDRSLSPEWVRKWTHLARKRFASLLLEEVARSLANPAVEELESELHELGWIDYCREALRERGAAAIGGGRPPR
jgi:DNA-directed RNA polymerase specialized sigma24 family protein